jgi:hypothetical protein
MTKNYVHFCEGYLIERAPTNFGPAPATSWLHTHRPCRCWRLASWRQWDGHQGPGNGREQRIYNLLVAAKALMLA